MKVLVKEIAAALNVSAYDFQKKHRRTGRFLAGAAGMFVVFESLPADVRAAYRAACSQEEPVRVERDDEVAPLSATAHVIALQPIPQLQADLAEAYLKAPDHNKRLTDKYHPILAACEGLTGAGLQTFVEQWNAEHPDKKTSYQSILRKRKEIEHYGADALMGQYGKRRYATCVPDDVYEVFKSAWMSDKRPPNYDCWQRAWGWANLRGYNMDDFPRVGAFMRRLKNDVPEGSRYLARFGADAYNRKYGSTLHRTTKNILAGAAWVGDNNKADIIVISREGKLVRPEITVWRCKKSGFWLGWDVHAEATTSNHVFSAFRVAAREYGVPSDIFVDNGPDYRDKDFSGGHKNHNKKNKIYIEGARMSLCEKLGITVHFVKPYRGQSKEIERDFRIFTEKLLKQLKGYTGNTVVNKPDSLKRERASGDLYTIDEFRAIVDDFVINVMNRRIISSGERKNKSPLEIMQEEYHIAAERGLIKVVAEEQLKLLCCRTSKPMNIRRNSIYDSECNSYYYADWILGFIGKKVYLRRDETDDMDKADVYDFETNEFMGEVVKIGAVDGMATTPAALEELKRLYAMQAHTEKTIAAMAAAGIELPPELLQAALKNYVLAHEKEMVINAGMPLIKDTNAPLIMTYENKVIKKKSEMEKEGLMDLSPFGSMTIPEKSVGIYNFEWEREEALARTACAG